MGAEQPILKGGLMRKTVLALAAGYAVAVACNSSDIGGGGVDDPNANADGGSDMRGRIDPDAACASVKAAATLSKSPVDVIFVIDNSGSMTAEITEVENRVNSDFATIIANSGLDYRIIMVSRHGSSASQRVCVKSPLSGTTCNPIPAQPANTPNFRHYSVTINSTDSFQKILNTYKIADEFNLAPTGWSAWLRPNAYKTFIEVTDDATSGNLPNGMAANAVNFDAALLALDPAQFGTAAKRNYIFHAIVGVQDNPAGATTPYQPTAAEVNTKCGSAQNVGIEHQRLARLTGGLRYPVCRTTDYNAIFNAVAQGVISGSKVSCDFNIPDPPPMQEFKLDTAQLEFTPSNGGAARIFNQVPDQASCQPDSFYILNKRVYLCGTTCNDVQADSGAKIEFLLECNVIIG